MFGIQHRLDGLHVNISYSDGKCDWKFHCFILGDGFGSVEAIKFQIMRFYRQNTFVFGITPYLSRHITCNGHGIQFFNIPRFACIWWPNIHFIVYPITQSAQNYASSFFFKRYIGSKDDCIHCCYITKNGIAIINFNISIIAPGCLCFDFHPSDFTAFHFISDAKLNFSPYIHHPRRPVALRHPCSRLTSWPVHSSQWSKSIEHMLTNRFQSSFCTHFPLLLISVPCSPHNTRTVLDATQRAGAGDAGKKPSPRRNALFIFQFSSLLFRWLWCAPLAVRHIRTEKQKARQLQQRTAFIQWNNIC